MMQERQKIQRNRFDPYEDARLTNLVEIYGDNWGKISVQMPNRSNRQCKESWFNYLSPNVNNSEWSPEEDSLLVTKVEEFGNRWKFICSFFQNRSYVNLKNRYTVLKKRGINAQSTLNQQNNNEELFSDIDYMMLDEPFDDFGFFSIDRSIFIPTSSILNSPPIQQQVQTTAPSNLPAIRTSHVASLGNKGNSQNTRTSR